MLCDNRIDGGIGYTQVGGHSILSTCTDDVVLEPLGPFMFTAVTLGLLVLAISTSRNRFEKRTTRSKTARVLMIILTFFLVANIAMHALEIARLAANHDGIGLLPVCFVPLVFVLLSLYITRARWSPSNPSNSQHTAWTVVVALWALWMVVTVGVKLWSLSAVESVLGAQAYNGADSKYPESDKVIDNIVILCVYAVILGLHTPLQIVRRKAREPVEAQRL